MLVSFHNKNRGTSLGRRIQVASSLWSRAVGLIATPTLNPDEGLWLSPCKSVHSFFMRYAIDVAFVSSDGTVLHQETLKPWSATRWIRESNGVLELPVGTLATSATQVGDRLEMTRNS